MGHSLAADLCPEVALVGLHSINAPIDLRHHSRNQHPLAKANTRRCVHELSIERKTALQRLGAQTLHLGDLRHISRSLVSGMIDILEETSGFLCLHDLNPCHVASSLHT